jgi:pimeloyl-ACP methyl ester carboxylesterase
MFCALQSRVRLAIDDGGGSMTHLNPTQTAQAVTLGQLVNAAYTMYDNHPSNPLPPPVQLPGNYEFIAWVQMRDFIFNYGNWTCYGLIARNPSVANNYVLAIRGTSNWTEWWVDLTSMGLTPMPGFGEVGYGFYSVYQTLRIVSPLTPLGMGAAAAPAAESLESAGTFADQVAAAVQRHAAANQAPGVAAAAKKSVTVTGHSLGSALATLYVAQNSQTKKVETPLLCTLASPRVGDYEFKTIFDGLGIPSWRIVNEPDLIPNTPYFGFWHIATEYEYDSGWSTIPWPECWHSIYTYLHLLDPSQPLSSGCAWSTAKTAAPPLPANVRRMLRAPALPSAAEKEIAIAAPAGTSINITIKVG